MNDDSNSYHWEFPQQFACVTHNSLFLVYCGACGNVRSVQCDQYNYLPIFARKVDRLFRRCHSAAIILADEKPIIQFVFISSQFFSTIDRDNNDSCSGCISKYLCKQCILQIIWSHLYSAISVQHNMPVTIQPPRLSIHWTVNPLCFQNLQRCPTID